MIKYKNETVSLKDEHQQMATELYKLQQSYKQNQQQKKFIPLKPSTHWNITNNQLSQNFITNSAQVSSLQSLPPTIPKSQLLMTTSDIDTISDLMNDGDDFDSFEFEVQTFTLKCDLVYQFQ